MSVTKRSIFLAILFLIIAISIYVYSTMVGKKVVSDTTKLPTFIATDTDGAIYDETGRVIRTLVSTKTTYFDNKTLYVFENPLISSYSYKDNKIELWHMKGKKGHMITDKSAHISDNVLIYPGFEDSAIKRATANYLDYDFGLNTVTSEELVNIYGNDFFTTGTKFSFDLNSNVLKYKGNPNATYYPQSK
ncbi:MAG: LPS export ABC transporter periplasmic protein LptC [Succinivibrio sp.]|jgi:LPS export ABC transporter protein LptC|nr:LPS export ABC transporter periplasmic protein LptC [Succinivibrio sp.]